jgi:hypothetical protein
MLMVSSFLCRFRPGSEGLAAAPPSKHLLMLTMRPQRRERKDMLVYLLFGEIQLE